MTCKECQFWNRDGADGICRKNSPRPTIMAEGRTYTIVWPKLKADEPGCGDFKPFSIEEED